MMRRSEYSLRLLVRLRKVRPGCARGSHPPPLAGRPSRSPQGAACLGGRRVLAEGRGRRDGTVPPGRGRDRNRPSRRVGDAERSPRAAVVQEGEAGETRPRGRWIRSGSVGTTARDPSPPPPAPRPAPAAAPSPAPPHPGPVAGRRDNGRHRLGPGRSPAGPSPDSRRWHQGGWGGGTDWGAIFSCAPRAGHPGSPPGLVTGREGPASPGSRGPRGVPRGGVGWGVPGSPRAPGAAQGTGGAVHPAGGPRDPADTPPAPSS